MVMGLTQNEAVASDLSVSSQALCNPKTTLTVGTLVKIQIQNSLFTQDYNVTRMRFIIVHTYFTIKTTTIMPGILRLGGYLECAKSLLCAQTSLLALSDTVICNTCIYQALYHVYYSRVSSFV